MTNEKDQQDGEPPSKLPGILSAPQSAHSGIGSKQQPSRKEACAVDEEEAFGLVGNDVRIEIIRALGKHSFDPDLDPLPTFSELRSSSDVDIVSSQFNYHLQKLVGQYVENTDGGYRLRPEGKTLYRTLRAGTFTSQRSLPTVKLDQSCYYCSQHLELAYDDGMFTIQCHGCETLYDLIMAPPSAIRSQDNLQARVQSYNYHLRQAFAQGVCPTCANSLDTEILPSEETDFGDVVEREVYVKRSCGYCGNHSYLSLGSVFLHHPAVIGFCFERGLNVMSTPRWEIEFAATDEFVDIKSESPWELVLTVPCGDAFLELILDGSLAIIEHSVKSQPNRSEEKP